MTYPSVATLSSDAKSVAVVVTQPDGQTLTATIPTKPPIPPPAGLIVSPTTITFKITQGGALPPSQQVIITTTGTWKWSDSIKGFNVSAETGSGNATLTLKPNSDMQALTADGGGKATVTSGNISQTVTVIIKVAAPTTPPTQPPPVGSGRYANALWAVCPYSRFDAVTSLPLLVDHPNGISSVDFQLDGKLILTVSANSEVINFTLDPSVLTAGQHVLRAVVKPVNGKPRTVDVPIMVGQDSPNLQVIANKKVTSPTIPPVGKYLKYVNCEITANDWDSNTVWAERSAASGWLGNVWAEDCKMHDVGDGFRDFLAAIRCSVNHTRGDAYSDVQLVWNCTLSDVGPIDVDHHCDAAQFSGPDGCVVNSIIDGLVMRAPDGSAVNGQFISYSGGHDMLLRNCDGFTNGGNVFYCDASNGPITDLYIKNGKFAGGYKGQWLKGTNTVTGEVIENSNLDISAGPGVIVR